MRFYEALPDILESSLPVCILNTRPQDPSFLACWQVLGASHFPVLTNLIGTEQSALPFPFQTPLANNFDPNSLFSAVPMTGNSGFRDWNQDTHSLGMPGLK